MKLLSCAVLAVVLGVGANASAEEARGVITGRISDIANNALPGATVHIEPHAVSELRPRLFDEGLLVVEGLDLTGGEKSLGPAGVHTGSPRSSGWSSSTSRSVCACTRSASQRAVRSCAPSTLRRRHFGEDT